jgi:hypothetical protein
MEADHQPGDDPLKWSEHGIYHRILCQVVGWWLTVGL